MNTKKMLRQKAALARLEKSYELFKAAKKDKAPYDSTRNGRTIHHRGRSYAEECQRMSNEIQLLKSRLSRIPSAS